MVMNVLMCLVYSALAADGVTSEPVVGLELTANGDPGDGVQLLAAARELDPFAIRVEPDRLYASSTDDVYRALAELLPSTGLDMSLAMLVATVDDEGAEVPGGRLWRFEQQVEGVPVVGAGVAVVTEDGSVRRVDGALFLDRGASNVPGLDPEAAAERAVEAVEGGEVAAVLPYVLPVGADLRHTWYVRVEAGVGGYEVAIDAETGEVLQLVLPQLGHDTGRFGSSENPFGPVPYGIIIGNGTLLGHSAGPTGVRLAGVSLVDGKLVRR
jgi:hypothetical protein